eukprot:TRINITY_DN114714_c0_g1_i1.p1 TRINITY_DN114714_c0_g1~~TRINITY_DN114714_c0_g1_i1.p1  ORF type:complete len:466 (+),score=22.50 TRINITY_DN114714_c0_g1_i1:426-1823(+)
MQCDTGFALDGPTPVTRCGAAKWNVTTTEAVCELITAPKTSVEQANSVLTEGVFTAATAISIGSSIASVTAAAVPALNTAQTTSFLDDMRCTKADIDQRQLTGTTSRTERKSSDSFLVKLLGVFPFTPYKSYNVPMAVVALLPCIFLLHWLILVLLKSCTKHSWVTLRGTCRMPYLYYLLLQVLLQPFLFNSLFAGFHIQAGGTAARAIWPCCGVVAYLVLTVLLFFRVKKLTQNNPTLALLSYKDAYSERNTPKNLAPIISVDSLPSFCCVMPWSKGLWIATSTSMNALRTEGCVFIDYKPRFAWFKCIEFGVMILNCIFATLPTSCDIGVLFLDVSALAYLVSLVALRPYMSPALNVSAALMQLTLCIYSTAAFFLVKGQVTVSFLGVTKLCVLLCTAVHIVVVGLEFVWQLKWYKHYRATSTTWDNGDWDEYGYGWEDSNNGYDWEAESGAADWGDYADDEY